MSVYAREKTCEDYPGRNAVFTICRNEGADSTLPPCCRPFVFLNRVRAPRRSPGKRRNLVLEYRSQVTRARLTYIARVHPAVCVLSPLPIAIYDFHRKTPAKKSKKRAREEADKSEETEGEGGGKGEEAKADGSSSSEKRPRGQTLAGAEVQEGAVDAATRKALAKAAIGIVKKVRRGDD